MTGQELRLGNSLHGYEAGTSGLPSGPDRVLGCQSRAILVLLHDVAVAGERAPRAQASYNRWHMMRGLCRHWLSIQRHLASGPLILKIWAGSRAPEKLL